MVAVSDVAINGTMIVPVSSVLVLGNVTTNSSSGITPGPSSALVADPRQD
jgi:hypothetical protein